MSSNKMATKADLQEMYSRILPYLGGSADAGFTPVGPIISVMGVTAPANYLACNGQVVNIADYPELANYFYQQFGSKNKFGGDGTTTFGIPDLRGEFLRGTGTNSHTNQGNGAAVGTHQDATIIPYLVSWHGSTPQSGIMGASESDLDVKNPDKAWKRSSGTLAWAKASSFTSGTTGMTNDSFITRPTNTSVLYCIATKNIYMNPSLDYSTDEKVVGTWVGGETLYQRTWVVTAPTPTTDAWNVELFSLSGLNIADVIDIKGSYRRNDNQIWNIYNYGFGSESSASSNLNAYMIFVFVRQIDGNPSAVAINTGKDGNVLSGGTVRITLQYTKFT